MQEPKEVCTLSPDSDRQIAVYALYAITLPTIQNKILESFEMDIREGEYLAGEYLATHLDEYTGHFEEDPFIEWALSLPEINRHIFFHRLRREYRRSILAGVWSILGENLDLADHENVGFVSEQIESNAWAWVWQHIGDLMVPGTASLATRLQAQATFQAMTWRQNRLRENARFDEADIEGFGLDLSDGKTYFDPGGHPDDPDEGARQRPQSRTMPSPSDSVLAMKSSRPHLLCPSCKSLQAISPTPASEPDAVMLGCGHERQSFLSISG